VIADLLQRRHRRRPLPGGRSPLLVEIELDSGNRASAQRAGRRCIQLLRDDLGVDPSAQTQEVLRRAGA